MRTKKDILFSVLAILVGIVPFIVLAIIALESFASLGNANMGIIGGADGPTVALRVQWDVNDFIKDNPLFAIFVYSAVPIFLSGAFYLIFTKFVKQNCTLKTSAVALGISASLGLGAYCFFTFAFVAAFGDLREHPILFPSARIFGVLSFVAFVALSVLYVFLRKKKMSVKGIIIEFVLTVIYVPAFFFGFSCVHQILSDIIAKFQ